MHNQDFFYTAKPIEKKVTREEFDEFVKNYPRKLECNVCGICEPPAVSLNDFDLANRWPYSVVAHYLAYDTNPKSPFYMPPEEWEYFIVENHEELFASKTGNKASDGE